MGRRGEREWGGGGECTRRVRENVLQMVEMWPFAAMIAKKKPSRLLPAVMLVTNMPGGIKGAARGA